MINMQATGSGTLYIVATPIGNREDISLRALEVLKSVDLILAEDTRHSLPLLNLLGIKNTLKALHAHNEKEKTEQFIEQLKKGTSIALISDAGTPLICDPGFPLVQIARKLQIPVVPIPGPCALITALCASGVACDSFLFSGFLPAKHNARMAKLESLSEEPHSLIFYESTHRIIDALEDIAKVYGPDCELVLAKELTKTFEQFISGTVSFVKTWLLDEAARTKGEFVIIIPPRPDKPKTEDGEELLTILLETLPLKQAVSLAVKITKENKNELYERALRIKATQLN